MQTNLSLYRLVVNHSETIPMYLSPDFTEARKQAYEYCNFMNWEYTGLIKEEGNR